ncbi:signal peptidase II [Gilvimarinus polysaccharolyticus]|uniref:signal peptidase II n=1 Tax=Gilvimarinus polysaccharolyticus TaxID=863921 RepID=UPI000ACFFDB9|nr:signal peptidase II [Gilvimarinus polysaccharolyticus]
MFKKIAHPWCWYMLALVVFVLDQWSKTAIVASLDYNSPLVLNAYFNFTLLYNPGAAFSFLSDAGGWQRWFFTAIAAVFSVVIVVWLARLPKVRWLEAMALGFVLGGALGNLYDRVMLGHVVDFIVVHYQDSYFPAFNLADAAICFGAFWLIVDMLFGSKVAVAETARNGDSNA